jgi:hypothetical protein
MYGKCIFHIDSNNNSVRTGKTLQASTPTLHFGPFIVCIWECAATQKHVEFPATKWSVIIRAAVPSPLSRAAPAHSAGRQQDFQQTDPSERANGGYRRRASL